MSETLCLTHAALQQWTGTEHWYRHGINRAVLFTDGATEMADTGGAYGLFKEIARAAVCITHDRRSLPRLDVPRPSRPHRHAAVRRRQR